MSGNRTLSSLLTDLRALLNEPSAGFWTDTQLKQYLRMAHRNYYAKYASAAPELLAQEATVTYTANARNIDLSVEPPIDRIFSIEDRTSTASNQTGYVFREAGSYEELLAVQGSGLDYGYGYSGAPAIYWLEDAETMSSGVVTVTQRLWIAPIPGSSRSLYIRYQAQPSEFDDDNDTSGLPEHVEQCILLQAGVYARTQEENQGGIAVLKAMLADAEDTMRKLSRARRRGPGRIIYRNVD